MDSLNDSIREYQLQLSKGEIQKAYRGIMAFMSSLQVFLEKRHSAHTIGSLYFGYMDMTYFAFTGPELRERKLKIAVVYTHEQGRFEGWLSGNNRKIQAEYSERLASKDTGKYALSPVLPGVDSIIVATLIEKPDFDKTEELRLQLEEKVLSFTQDMLFLVEG